MAVCRGACDSLEREGNRKTGKAEDREKAEVVHVGSGLCLLREREFGQLVLEWESFFRKY